MNEQETGAPVVLMVTDHYLRAETKEALWAALADAGIAVIVPAQMEEVPEHEHHQWRALQDEHEAELIAALTEEFGTEERIVAYAGEQYRYDEDGWRELEILIVPAHSVERPARLIVREGYAYDEIGIIHLPNGEFKWIEGELVELSGPVPGFHANLMGVLTAEQQALLPLIPKPKKRVRAYAGT